jgi:hypothetical protein
MMLFLRKNAMQFAPPPAEATVIMRRWPLVKRQRMDWPVGSTIGRAPYNGHIDLR